MDTPGDLEAFVDRQHPRLVGALSLYCGDPLVAEELAQEALIRCCGNWSKLREMANPEAWAHRVAKNLAHSFFRRRAAERRAYARRGASQEHIEIDLGTSVAVREALAKLPRRQREVLVLRYFADLPVATVAESVGISEGAVKSLTHRAVQALRDQLGESVPATEGVES